MKQPKEETAMNSILAEIAQPDAKKRLHMAMEKVLKLYRAQE